MEGLANALNNKNLQAILLLLSFWPRFRCDNWKSVLDYWYKESVPPEGLSSICRSSRPGHEGTMQQPTSTILPPASRRPGAHSIHLANPDGLNEPFRRRSEWLQVGCRRLASDPITRPEHFSFYSWIWTNFSLSFSFIKALKQELI